MDLVGRPLTIGNFVSTSSVGFIITATTNTYTPYIELDDEAFPDPSHNETITGTSYQEVLTNFPLGSQVLTGLFLNITLSGPQGASDTFNRTLFDRIGYAARQGLVPANISIPPGGAPAFTNQDVYTLNVQPGLQDPNVLAPLAREIQALAQQIQANSGSVLTPALNSASQSFTTALTQFSGINYLGLSDYFTQNLASSADVTAYEDRPRLILTGVQVTPSADQKTADVSQTIDLRSDHIRVEVAPGQNVAAEVAFNVARAPRQRARSPRAS